MVTGAQVRVLRKKRMGGKTIEAAAIVVSGVHEPVLTSLVPEAYDATPVSPWAPTPINPADLWPRLRVVESGVSSPTRCSCATPEATACRRRSVGVGGRSQTLGLGARG